MTIFEIRECTDPACCLRVPIDLDVHRGSFCPKCGAPMRCVVPAYQNQTSRGEKDFANLQMDVLLDNLRSVYNVGAIFRTSEGVGVRHLYLCGITPNPTDNPEIAKIALGAERAIPWSAHPNALVLAQHIQKQGSRLLVLERTPLSVLIYQYRPDQLGDDPVTLILGNERAGVDPGLITLCDAVIALPMAGEKNSLNVAVAFSAAAYWLSFTRSLKV